MLPKQSLVLEGKNSLKILFCFEDIGQCLEILVLGFMTLHIEKNIFSSYSS